VTLLLPPLRRGQVGDPPLDPRATATEPRRTSPNGPGTARDPSGRWEARRDRKKYANKAGENDQKSYSTLRADRAKAMICGKSTQGHRGSRSTRPALGCLSSDQRAAPGAGCFRSMHRRLATHGRRGESPAPPVGGAARRKPHARRSSDTSGATTGRRFLERTLFLGPVTNRLAPYGRPATRAAPRQHGQVVRTRQLGCARCGK